MAYGVLIWKDHSITPDKTYTITENSDKTITLTPAGKIIQQGTNMSATNFNNLETGVLAGNITAIEAMRLVNLLKNKVDGLEGVIVEASLTNTSNYPFNNSSYTVALTTAQTRHTKDYTVIVEVTESSGGGVGDIIVSDKLLNGFKVSFTGSAKSVKLKCYIQGGLR